MRLRDLAPAVAEPVPSAEHDDPGQPAAESAAPAPPPPSNTSVAPAASAEADPPAVVDATPSLAEAPRAVDEEAPAVAAETAAAAVAQAVPGTDGVAAPIGDPTPPTAADAAPAPDPAGAPAPQATSLAVELAVDPTSAAPPIAPQRAAPDSVVAATSSQRRRSPRRLLRPTMANTLQRPNTANALRNRRSPLCSNWRWPSLMQFPRRRRRRSSPLGQGNPTRRSRSAAGCRACCSDCRASILGCHGSHVRILLTRRRASRQGSSGMCTPGAKRKPQSKTSPRVPRRRRSRCGTGCASRSIAPSVLPSPRTRRPAPTRLTP